MINIFGQRKAIATKPKNESSEAELNEEDA